MSRLATWISVSTAFLVPILSASPNSETRFAVEPSSRIELRGATNIGGWECRGRGMSGALTVRMNPIRIEQFLAAVEQFEAGPIQNLEIVRENLPVFAFSVPVDGLDCGNRRMERDLRKALRYPSHENIEFELKELHWVEVERREDGPMLFRVDLEGSLSLAGETKLVDIEILVTREKQVRTFQVDGSIEVRMTDFGVVPPVALLGLIRAADQLTVEFRLFLREETARSCGSVPARPRDLSRFPG